MKQFFKILFACLCAFILFFAILFVSLIGIAVGSASSSTEVSVEKNSILMLDLTEPISEQTLENSFAAFSGGDNTTGLNDIVNSIQHAKTDNNIKGIYIKLGSANSGWATLKEVKDALEDFKTSKKFVYAYGEYCDQKSYYIASLSDKVFINPSGMFEFLGLGITGTFYKGTLDKLDISTEAFHCGKYKGAYEPYKLEKFSEPNRFQLATFLSDVHSEFLSSIHKYRGIDTATLANLSKNGSIKFPKDALAAKLIDGLVYVDSVNSLLRIQTDTKEKDKLNFINPEDYASTITQKSSKNKIAILYAEGAIDDGDGGREGIHSKTMIKQIRKITNDDNIKAVVLRINSPGGSALASEVIYHELLNLKKKKPVVVSMGNYAASGGYYIACASDSIFADVNTLTGSIGVVGVMMNYGNMMKNKLGVTFDNVKTGTYSDFPNPTRPMTDAERTWIQSYLDTTYIQFKSRVAAARHLTMEQVEDLAQGHVYSGKLGKELKLVDELGSTQRALKSAASMAKLSEYKLVEYPKPVDKFSEIIENLSGKKHKDAILKSALGDDYKVYMELQKIKAQQGRIMATLPFDIDIR